MTEVEREQRIHLAAAYQLAEHFGWTMLVWNHISARVPGTQDQFLINPLGLMYDEITASNLVKVDTNGHKLVGEGETSPAGFVIHGAVHQARHDVECVMHMHTPEAVALSCLQEGLPQLCGETAYFHEDIGYHDYEGVSLDLDEQSRIAESLGAKNNLILKNHGLITTGRSAASGACAAATNVLADLLLSHRDEPLRYGPPFHATERSLGGKNRRAR